MTAMQVTDQEYSRLFDQALSGIQTHLDAFPDLLDWDMHGDILYIRFEDGETVVINKQPPLHQLWFASKEGGKQFEWQGTEWIDVRDGVSLTLVLQQLWDRKGLRA